MNTRASALSRDMSRRVGLAAASVTAILVACLYVPLAGGSLAHASALVTALTGAKSEVVYGKFTSSGHAQQGAIIVVSDSSGRTIGRSRTTVDGTYRMVLHAKAGTFKFTFRKTAHARPFAVRHALLPGMHLRVTAAITNRGFVWLPFFHY